MATKIKIRRDVLANFVSANPTLANGELTYITDTGKMKVGDGTTAWNDLDYFTPADDDEFYSLLTESSVNANDDYILIYDTSETEYRKISRKNFLNNDNIKIIADIDTAKAIANGEDNDLIYVPETDTIYRYETAGSSFTADNMHVLITGTGGDTRWLGVSGQFSIKNIDLMDGAAFKINGTQVVGPQQSAINTVTGTAGGTYGSTEMNLINDLKTRLNEVLTILRTHGLINS